MSTPQIHLETLPRSIQLVMTLGFLALAAFPFVGSDFYSAMVVRMMILAIFAMSLDLLQGVTGLVSLGHAAYFGLAGYVLAFITPQNEAISLYTSLPLAVAPARSRLNPWAISWPRSSIRQCSNCSASSM